MQQIEKDAIVIAERATTDKDTNEIHSYTHANIVLCTDRAMGAPFMLCFDPPSGPTLKLFYNRPASVAVHNLKMNSSFFRAPVMSHRIRTIHFSRNLLHCDMTKGHALL